MKSSSKTVQGKPLTLLIKDIPEKPGPYCMSYGFSLDPLLRSIERFGLMHKPFVIRKDNGTIDIVAGFRRILALRRLSWSEVPCFDLTESGLPPLGLLQLNLYDNLSTRIFNPVEKGMILGRLMSHLPEGTVLDEFMPLLDLPSHGSVLAEFLALEKMDQKILTALVNGDLSFKTVKALMEIDAPARTTMFEWIIKLKLNSNKQMLFVDIINDLSIKEDESIPDLLENNPSISRILENDKLNLPQKASLVIDYFRQRRFPRLIHVEKAFKKMIADLNLPAGVRIDPPPFFEGEGFKMEISFKNGETLQEKIRDLAASDRLARIADSMEMGDQEA